MRRTWGLIGLVATGEVAGAWWAISRPDRTTAANQAATAMVQRHHLVASVAATGKVTPMVGAEVRVGSRESGRVQHLHANIGDAVRQDQVIAELEKHDQQALLEQRRAELRVADAKLSSVGDLRHREVQKAESALADAKATADLAVMEFDRQSALFSRGDRY